MSPRYELERTSRQAISLSKDSDDFAVLNSDQSSFSHGQPERPAPIIDAITSDSVQTRQAIGLSPPFVSITYACNTGPIPGAGDPANFFRAGGTAFQSFIRRT